MITDYIILTVRAMAEDPASPETLRRFHRQLLTEILERNKPRPPPAPSPFSRFADALESPDPLP